MSIDIFLILFSSFILPFSLFFLVMNKKTREMDASKLPPGPKKLPIIGNLHQIGKLPHRSLQNLSKKYGDLMFLQLGSIPTLIVSSPDMAREIFKTHDLVFSGRVASYGVRKVSYDYTSITFGPYSEYWRYIRRTVVLELMTLKRVQSFGNIRIQEISLMINRIASATNYNPVDLSALAFSLTNSVVSRVVFGTSRPVIDDHSDKSDDGNKFQEMFREIQSLAAEFNIADYFPRMAWINKFNGVDRRMEKNFEELDKFLDKVLEEHRDPHRPKTEHEDIVDVLLRAQKDPNQDTTLKDEQIKSVLTDIFVAGTDTSSATIIWTMAELLRNPRVKEKAQQEVRKMFKEKSTIEESDLPQLTYLKLIIKESWRLHAPAPLFVPRETTQNCTINNKYHIPSKTRVLFNAAAIQTDPKHWDNPQKFWPERPLNSEIDFRGQNYELLPFGAGRRGCPGINFAVPLVELALANLLYCFDWELPPGMAAEDIDMEEAMGVTMHKKVPLCLVASLRKFELKTDGSAAVSDAKISDREALKIKEWEVEMLQEEVAASQGIKIRRRPPTGPPLHYVGPFEFRSRNEGNIPNDILEEIIWYKDVEVSQMKEKKPLPVLKAMLDTAPTVRDFIGALKKANSRTGVPGLIAEVKKASPSRGVLREDFDPVQIAKAYEKGGAACLSVLTDKKYFQGSFENLEAIRNSGVQCPLLCKEFVIDAWQIYNARVKGADAILLIAAVLPDLDIKYMINICKALGLAALVEVHDEREMDRVIEIEGIELIGINNRDLGTFKVDIANTKRLLDGERGQRIREKGIIVVGESGLFTPTDIAYVQEAGVKAVLVGESIVKQKDPTMGITQLFGKDISS